MKLKFKALLAVAALPAAVLFGVAASANAADSILYRNDAVLGTDYLGQAVNSGAYAVTNASGDLSGFDLSKYDIVVYANQNLPVPGGDLAQLNAYVASGGRVIFDDYNMDDGFSGDASFTGGTNQTSLKLSMFNQGVASPLTLTNPGWSTFSTSLDALSGGVLGGVFGDGSGAIVVGDGGRTIVNGFMSDTVASEQLYLNELGSLSVGAVPEPATWAMLMLGVAAIGCAARRRRDGAPAAA